MTALFFSLNIQSYVPENFDSTKKYLLFLASAVPDLALYLVMVGVGTILLSARTWDILKLLRWVIAISVLVKIVAAAVDVTYFPDSLDLNFLSYLSIVTESIWLAYLFRSTRVKHVFKSHDWETAVNSIYPLQPKIAT